MMLARLGSLRAMRPIGRLARVPSVIPTPPMALVIQARRYNEFNRIEDMLGAAEAWHLASALPNKFDRSTPSLRSAFDRMDLNGNGVIEANELKAAIMEATDNPAVDDHLVDEMIKWACKKTPNGDIDFEEYCSIMRVKLPSMVSYFNEQKLGRDTI